VLELSQLAVVHTLHEMMAQNAEPPTDVFELVATLDETAPQFAIELMAHFGDGGRRGPVQRRRKGCRSNRCQRCASYMGSNPSCATSMHSRPVVPRAAHKSVLPLT